MKKISHPQIPEEQIESIIERAIELQVTQNNIIQPQFVTTEYIKKIGTEIDVEDGYIQQAIEEYIQKNTPVHNHSNKNPSHDVSEKDASNKNLSSAANSKAELPMSKTQILALGLVTTIGIIIMLVLRDSTPKYNVGSNSTLIAATARITTRAKEITG